MRWEVGDGGGCLGHSMGAAGPGALMATSRGWTLGGGTG